MNHQFLTIEQFNELINQWNGQNIKIEKMELDDKDEIHLLLTNVSYSTDTHRIDDYKARHALELNGPGEIRSDQGYYPLPDSTYIIPLQDSSLYEFDGKQFLLTTDRGVYKIRLES